MADYNPVPDAPIGVFDSGLGGLTIFKALANALPNETLLYYGDTAHMPYGDKSTEQLQQYIRAIAAWLLQQQVKVIVIACNTATAAGYELVRTLAGKVPVIEVVTPTIAEAAAKAAGNRIGLIATNSTVASQVYPINFARDYPSLTVVQHPVPRLAPMIEAQYATNDYDASVLHEAMANPAFGGLTTVILGSTHYTLAASELAEQFRAIHGHPPQFINSIAPTTRAVVNTLRAAALLREDQAVAAPPRALYVSRTSAAFAAAAQLFLGEAIPLIELPLGSPPVN